jgi:dephospho-CoA kinase
LTSGDGVKRVLLTGMSGTGKSTVIGALAARGYKALDVDDLGWYEYTPDGAQVWREDHVSDLHQGNGDGHGDRDLVFSRR